jgi:AraC-like DNA-binding protein
MSTIRRSGSSAPSSTASSDGLRILTRGMRYAGLNAEPLLAAIGIAPALLDESGVRLPISSARSVWSAASLQSGDPAFGFRVAQGLGFGSLELLDELLATSSSLGEAFQRLTRYTALLVDTGEVALITTGREARFVHRAVGGIPWLSQTFFSLVLRRTRELFDPAWTPSSVAFMDPYSGPLAEIEGVFDAPVAVGAPLDEIVFDAATLQLRPRARPRPSSTSCVSVAERLIAGLGSQAPDFSLLYERVAQSVLDGNTKLEIVAEGLGLSARTFQRRLQAAGTGHRELVEHVRSQIAARELGWGGAKQREVSRALGYSSPSAFHRARRRWLEREP